MWKMIAGLISLTLMAQVPSDVYRTEKKGFAMVQVISRVDPAYSEEGLQARAAGTVLIQAMVAPEGKASEIKVVRSLGFGLDEKAIEAVSAWTFRPGMKVGIPVSVRVTIEVNFRLLTQDPDPASLEFSSPPGVSPPHLRSFVAPKSESFAVPKTEFFLIDFRLDEKGVPQNVRVKNPASAESGEAIRGAVAQWRFDPATSQAGPVAVDGHLQYLYGAR